MRLFVISHYSHNRRRLTCDYICFPPSPIIVYSLQNFTLAYNINTFIYIYSLTLHSIHSSFLFLFSSLLSHCLSHSHLSMASSPIIPTHLPPVSPSLSTKSPEALISFTIENVGSILECSTQRRSRHEQLPHLAHFVRETYFKCQLSPTVLIVALIYLERLKSCLPVQARGGMSQHSMLRVVCYAF